MKNKYNLYILLTKTPLKTGKIIRKFTKFEYNHCSITFDKNFNTLYSFTRKHKNSTFYAGLVKESSLRFIEGNEKTKVQIFKIPLTSKQYKKLKKYIENLEKHEEEYIYNYINVLTYFFKKNIKVEKAYTCSEFTIHILKEFCKNTGFTKDYYLIYEGEYNVENSTWQTDKYLEKQNIISKIYKTTELFTLLIYRYIKGIITK